MLRKASLKMYGRMIQKYPVAVNCLTAVGLFAIGDVTAQMVVEREPQWDSSRTIKAAAYGIIWGPVGDKWYKILKRVGKDGDSPLITTLKKVAIDQLVFAPVVGIPLYYTCLGIFNGMLVLEIKHQLEYKWSDTVKANWMVWPWVQIVNFYFVPVHYQLGASTVAGLGWNTYLSWKNYQEFKTV